MSIYCPYSLESAISHLFLGPQISQHLTPSHTQLMTLYLIKKMGTTRELRGPTVASSGPASHVQGHGLASCGHQGAVCDLPQDQILQWGTRTRPLLPIQRLLLQQPPKHTPPFPPIVGQSHRSYRFLRIHLENTFSFMAAFASSHHIFASLCRTS